MKKLLLCDEAIAQAAMDAGLSGMYAYPGTPSTEIMEYIQSSKQAEERNIHRHWSSNEKTAMEAALGMSYSGKRAMVAMKHVGLNVAADGFVNSAITGVNGGLVVVVADDPSMHSSQNEQDSRYYAKFANVPCFEPSNQQEAYNMIFDAFDLSEKYKTPVLFRITTRIAHSRSVIELADTALPNKELNIPEDSRRFILLPAIAKNRYRELLKSYEVIKNDPLPGKYNCFSDGKDKKLGIIACGIAYNYLMEGLRGKKEEEYPVLKISTYPLPKSLLEKIFERCNEIIVLEEGYPIVEELLRGLLDNGKKIKGRMDNTVPRDGELNPFIVAKAVGLDVAAVNAVPDIVKQRPPQFCRGCGHSDMYFALKEAVEPFGNGHVFADIGCYTLGALPPYNVINTCVDMGASISMATGATDAGLVPAIAVIGDSTFTHSGMTGLLDAVWKNSPVTIIISDNSTTAMTGGQQSQATGKLEQICRGIGVEPEHIRTILPVRGNHDENVRIMREEINYNGVSVILSQRECIQVAKRKKK